jgi:hypothetical protein
MSRKSKNKVQAEVVVSDAVANTILAEDQALQDRMIEEFEQADKTAGLEPIDVPSEPFSEAPAPEAQVAKVKWSDMWQKACVSTVKRVSEGGVAFRPGSKRDIGRRLLEKGCTLDEACAAFGWSVSVSKAQLTECVQLLGRGKTYKKVKDGERVLFVMPDDTRYDVKQEEAQTQAA